jgi:hypothetical protein
MEHKKVDCAVTLLSGEWIVRRRPNGGTVVLLRSIWIAVAFYAIGLVLSNLIDPNRSWRFSFREFRRQLLESFGWFVTIFAGAYAALYARFASQWSYLASVYNQIKATECKGVDADNQKRLAEWKAAFIDDAVNLHLAGKSSFREVVLMWSENKDVNEVLDEDIRSRLKILGQRGSSNNGEQGNIIEGQDGVNG